VIQPANKLEYDFTHSTTRIPAVHLRLRTVPGTEWRAGNELCVTVTESC
jgi:hypothetical protein